MSFCLVSNNTVLFLLNPWLAKTMQIELNFFLLKIRMVMAMRIQRGIHVCEKNYLYIEKLISQNKRKSGNKRVRPWGGGLQQAGLAGRIAGMEFSANLWRQKRRGACCFESCRGYCRRRFRGPVQRDLLISSTQATACRTAFKLNTGICWLWPI